VNHFEKNASITTKIGLCKNIRSLVWFENVDINTFFPRCFDMNDFDDIEKFTDEFKLTKAISILKRYMRLFKQKNNEHLVLLETAKIAVNVVKSNLKDLDEIIDEVELE